MISIIIPTYNEAKNIENTAKIIFSSINDEKKFELIIVDEQSTDGTKKILENLPDKYNVKIVTEEKKRGISPAIMRGFQEANGEILIVMDADLQHPPKKIPHLIKEIEKGADVVICSRYLSKSKIKDWPSRRKIISKGAIDLCKVFFPSLRNMKDPISGFFAIKKEVIENTNFDSVGIKIILDILRKGEIEKVKEIPYHFKAREKGKSKFKYRNILKFIIQLLKLLKTGKRSNNPKII